MDTNAIIDDFKLRFSEFKDDTSVDTLLPFLIPTISCYYGGEYSGCNKEIILLLLAHLFTANSSRSLQPLRNVASHAAGNVSTSFETFSNGSNLNAFFGTTKYGMMYLQLISNRGGCFFV